jgi:ABC-type sugar transport system substrate-binding protein
MAGTKYQISEPFDVNTENTANYGAWENLAAANPNMVAMVGLCSMDLPNLAKLKERTKGQWLVGGYDLGRETLDAVKAGTVQVTIGQHPYLQGYLPVGAGPPLPRQKTAAARLDRYRDGGCHPRQRRGTLWT